MDDSRRVYYIRLPLEGATPEQLGLGSHYIDVARAITPESLAAAVAALAACPTDSVTHIRVEIRREL